MKNEFFGRLVETIENIVEEDNLNSEVLECLVQ